jgi:spore maturation protein CgeB
MALPCTAGAEQSAQTLRVLVVNTDYPDFLRWFYEREPELVSASYERQMQARVETLFGVADFYTRNLRELGHEAWDIHANNGVMQQAWARELGVVRDRRRARLLGAPARVRRLLRGRPARQDPRLAIDPEILAAQVEHYAPDVLFNQAMTEISPTLLASIRQRVPVIVGQHAATPLPDHRDYSVYDLVVSSYRPTLEWFSARGVRAALSRLAFEPSILTLLGPREPLHPVSFVGSFHAVHSSRVEFLEALCREIPELRIWAPSLEGIDSNSPIRDHYAGVAWGLEMYRVLRGSKIVINHHGDIKPYANNLRLFEATGVGSLLVTDAQSDLDELFAPGREVVAYRTVDESIEAIRLYRADSAAADAIAAAGQQRTLGSHTYRDRMQEFTALVDQLA